MYSLSSSQTIIASLMGMTVLLFIALSLYFLIRGIYLKRIGKSETIFAGRPAHFVLIIHAFTVMLIIAVLYAFFVEPTQLTASTYKFSTEHVKRPLGFVLVSDLKYPNCKVPVEDITSKIDAFAPDVLLFGGDMTDLEDTPQLTEAFNEVACENRFFCLGNVNSFADIEFCESVGAKLLKPHGQMITIGGASIFIATDTSEKYPDIHSTPPPSNAFSILLTHSPELVPSAAAFEYDLYLAGHTLGGQVRLPFAPDLFLPGQVSRLFPPGRHHVDAMHVIICRGIGTSPRAPGLRFLCLPEIVYFELVPDISSDSTNVQY
ncbi:MAG: hypothetical protein U5N86_07695 [Planctomycetota bacterium]|nr:hypothetical protein [Planctomycetota bacterium]